MVAGGKCQMLPLKATEEDEKEMLATVSLAAANEISFDAAI